MSSEENKIFIENFHPEKFGFFGLTPYINVNIGFSVKKKLRESDKNNVTLLSIYISKRTDFEIQGTKKPLSIHATYGKIVEGGGVTIRERFNITEPIDLEFPDEYYYNIASNEFFKRNKKINADEIFLETYYKHIKPTRLIMGIGIRTEIIFYRVFLKLIFEYISIYFHSILYLVSGDLYSYSFVFDERKRNGEIISSNTAPPDKGQKKLEKEEEKSKEINFLGYKISPFCIFFYSGLHLYLYFVLSYYKFNLPLITKRIFENSFLILVYVMFSLILIDKVLPPFLELLIDKFSKWSFKAEFKTIKIADDIIKWPI